MAYDEDLAESLRAHLEGVEGCIEKKMFGGLAFLLHGNMAVAASGQGGLMVRVDPDDAERWIDGDRVAPVVMRGREMRGWLRVLLEPDDEELGEWVGRGLAFAASLPQKGA